MRRPTGDRPLLGFHLRGYRITILVLGAMAVFSAATGTQDWRARAALVGLWALFALWLQRVRVEVHADVLLVRDGFRVARVAWQQVRSIHAETDPFFGPTAVVRLSAAGQIRLDTLTTGRGGDDDIVRDRVAQLERWRHDRPPRSVARSSPPERSCAATGTGLEVLCRSGSGLSSPAPSPPAVARTC